LSVILKEKYGEPLTEKINWKNTFYADDGEDDGFALSLGHLDLYSIWETENSSILLKIEGENYEISLSTIYESKNPTELLEKKKKKVLDDF